MSEPTGHTYTRSHPVSGKVLLLDVEAEAKQILDAARAARVGHAAKTLVKQGPLRIVVMGMKQGSAVREHKAEGPASIHVLTGHVTISGGNASTDVRGGQAMISMRMSFTRSRPAPTRPYC